MRRKERQRRTTEWEKAGECIREKKELNNLTTQMTKVTVRDFNGYFLFDDSFLIGRWEMSVGNVQWAETELLRCSRGISPHHTSLDVSTLPGCPCDSF